MRVLVAGATGLLGSHLCAVLAPRHEVVALARGRDPSVPADDWVVADLANEVDPADVLEREGAEAVVNCVAITDAAYCEREPGAARLLNVDVPTGLALACRARGARFVHLSTDWVFGGPGAPFREEDPVRPLNEYARTKSAGERAVLSADPGAVVVRTTFFGWGRDPARPGIVPWLLREMRAGRSVRLAEDWLSTPLYVEALAGALAELVERDLHGTLHIASPDAVSRADLGRLVCAAWGLDTALVQAVPGSTLTTRDGLMRPDDTRLDATRARRVLRTPLPPVEEGLRWMRKVEEERPRPGAKGG